MKPVQVLQKYWNYHSFRPLQEEIINSVLEGRDTLALLPTGGGKSLCFQVPAMIKDGLCLVITPLISLMKDQVENLKSRRIHAVAIHSGMNRFEVELAEENCAFDPKIKFLYLSPERLTSQSFQQKLASFPVNIIVVDEAHCISQWGYDFRPPYLKIAEIRKVFPKAPVLALTATATPEVVKDIHKKLLFKQENVLQKSFLRHNLVYLVYEEENKYNRMLLALQRVKGSSIVYVRNRKRTREIAEFLQKNGISATWYHAGLETKIREQRQDEWKRGKVRTMVATNAFGMGIDKPDVRLVIHMDLPDCLEAYFQEAGRAGRDEQPAWALLLVNEADRLELKKNVASSYPEANLIKNIYNALCNHYGIAVGSGKDLSFDFDINDFSATYNLNPIVVYNAIRFLEREGLISLPDYTEPFSQLFIKVDKDELYRLQVADPELDNFVKTILRSYGGLFDDFVKIDEKEIAKRTNLTLEKVTEKINQLEKRNFVEYIPQKTKPQIVFSSERIENNNVLISPENYYFLKERAYKRLESVLDYTLNTTKCRSQILLSYFGETQSQRCGKCDICKERNKAEVSSYEFDAIIERIKPILQKEKTTIAFLIEKFREINPEKIMNVALWLIDNGKVEFEGDYIWWKK